MRGLISPIYDFIMIEHDVPASVVSEEPTEAS